jgi:multidrug resistance efflux pump
MKEPQRCYPWKLLGLVFLTAVLAGGGCQRAETPRDPATVPPGPSLVCLGYVDVEGGVIALNAARPGRVVRVLVRETERVKAGAPLLCLDDQRARFQVRQAEEALKAAEARLAQARRLPAQHQADLVLQREAVAAAQARLAAARQALQRRRNLQGINMASAQEVAIAADQVKEAEAALRAEEEKVNKLRLTDPAEQVAQAEAEAAGQQAKLEEARHALAERTLRAPADGEVLRLQAAAGDLLTPVPGQAALLFCPDQPRIVRAEVPQEFADRVRVGQATRIEDDLRPDLAWPGKVARASNWFTQRRTVLQEPARRNDERTLECIIALEPGGKPVRIGQRVRVLFED